MAKIKSMGGAVTNFIKQYNVSNQAAKKRRMKAKSNKSARKTDKCDKLQKYNYMSFKKNCIA